MSREGKVYVVRECAFFYTDEYYAPAGLGSVRGTYPTREKAEAACRRYQHQRLRSEAVTDYVFDDAEAVRATIAFFVEHFPSAGVDPSWRYFEDQIFVPKKATGAQLDALLAAMKVDFAKVFEMDAGASYFAVEVWPHRLGDAEHGDGRFYLCDGEGRVVLGTREECERALDRELRYRSEDGHAIQIGGPLAAITEMPEAFTALVQEHALVYDEALGTLRAEKKKDAPFTALLALLRDPPAKVVAVPFSEISKVEKLETAWPLPW